MNIGVVGVGYWGSKVAGEYRQLEKEGKIEKAVACDTDTKKLDAFDGKGYTDLDAFLEDVDGIHICTGNDTHYPVAKKALERGKNVLIEKPIVTSPRQAYDLVELAGEKGLILQSGHIFRFANVVRKVKELVEEGFLGDINYYNLRWTHKMEPVEGVDVLWDLLCHPLDILHFIEGEWPEEFSGKGYSFRRDGPNEAAFLDASAKSFKAHIDISWCDPVKRRVLQINGSEKSLVAHCASQEMKVYEGEEGKPMEVEANNTIRDEGLNFVESIESGKNIYNPAIVGARAVESVNKAVESLK